MTEKRQKKLKKPSKKKVIIFSILGVFGLLFWYGMQPIQGTILYGICKVFIEQTLTYPPEMKITSVIERLAENEVRMDYAYINEYGEYMVGAAQCKFRPDPVTGYALTELLINRQRVPQERVQVFNTTIPFILANPPSLIIPPGPAVELKDLQR